MWDITFSSMKGRRRTENQDRFVVEEARPGLTVAAVFDGHGPGTNTVDFCANIISAYVRNTEESSAKNSLLLVFKRIAEQASFYTDGSTASVVCLFDSGRIAGAVLGDSLVIL